MFASLIELLAQFRRADREAKPIVVGRIGLMESHWSIDTVEKVLLIILLLVGIYGVLDAYFIFYNSTTKIIGTQNKPKEIEAIKELTEDYVAWLKIDDTNIDYPIMQGSDNNEYLDKNPYGEYSLSGSIFLDCYNTWNFKDDYNLLYGHHMSGNFMFGALDSFRDEEYLLEHQHGTIETDDGQVYDLTLFCWLNGDAHDTIIFDTTIKNKDGLIEYAKPRSECYIDGIYDGTQKVVALTTCKTPASTRRTIILAVMHLRT